MQPVYKNYILKYSKFIVEQWLSNSFKPVHITESMPPSI